jgi:hypothetical protein
MKEGIPMAKHKIEMFADPVPLDEDDHQVKEEMFELHKYCGDIPESLVGATEEYRKEYAAWLQEKGSRV